MAFIEMEDQGRNSFESLFWSLLNIQVCSSIKKSGLWCLGSKRLMLTMGQGLWCPERQAYFKSLSKRTEDIWKKSVYGKYVSKINHCAESIEIGLWRVWLSSLVMWWNLFIRVTSESWCHACSISKINICDYTIDQSIVYEVPKRREEAVPSWHIRWLIVGPQ